VWLKKLVTAVGPTVDLDAYRMHPDFAAFAASSEFREFEKWYKARQK
jgi:hypothetical protein